MLGYSERWNLVMDVLRQFLPQNCAPFLVGGAVRDLLRGQPLHDLDLVLQGNIRSMARRVANALGGDFYMLDEERGVARVISYEPDGTALFIDFCTLRAPDLIADLVARDFTVNAIALDIHHPESLVDPCGGIADLEHKILRACTPQAFEQDPVRVLRGVRQSLALRFTLEAQTLAWMRAAAPLIGRVSAERQRDEFLRMLEGGQAQSAVNQLDEIGALAQVLPELDLMKGISQSPPHTLDVWQHTLALIGQLDMLWASLVEGAEPLDACEAVKAAVKQLGIFRPVLAEHFALALNPNRSVRSLVFLAGLYHDAAKPLTRSVEPEGRIRFFQHEEQGAPLAARRARELALSQDEVQRVETIVRQHMRVHQLDLTGQMPSRRAMYRFFRDTGPAGVDIILLTLADTLATYGTTLPQALWVDALQTSKALLEAWFERPAEVVRPPRLINGDDLIRELHLASGPQLGRLLAAIQEGQASGEITTTQEAMDLAKQMIREGK